MTSEADTELGRINEAADWYARLRAGDLTEIEAARFRFWSSREPANQQELEKLDDLWDELAAIESSPEVRQEQALIAAARGLHKGAPTRRRRVGGPRWIPVAAAVAGVAIGALLWLHTRVAGHYATEVGEQRVMPLDDGSIVTLNTSTEIKVRYSKALREVDLINGEANFEVAKDARRPFVVSVGGAGVRAVGTVFDIYKASGQVTVTLIEGKVAFVPPPVHGTEGPVSQLGSQVTATVTGPADSDSPSQARSTGEILLVAGEQLSFTPHSVAVRERHADLARISAWRARKLDFNDTPLMEAITEANRYSRVQIQLNAPALANARISGTFAAGQNELFVEGLQAYFHLQAVRSGKNQIILTLPPPMR